MGCTTSGHRLVGFRLKTKANHKRQFDCRYARPRCAEIQMFSENHSSTRLLFTKVQLWGHNHWQVSSDTKDNARSYESCPDSNKRVDNWDGKLYASHFQSMKKLYWQLFQKNDWTTVWPLKGFFPVDWLIFSSLKNDSKRAGWSQDQLYRKLQLV